MRSLAMTLGMLILAVNLTSAQQAKSPMPAPGSSPSPEEIRKKLDSVLQDWEKRMDGVKTIYAHLLRTTVNRVFNQTEVFEGGAKYMEGNRALFDLRKKGAPQVFERYLFTDANVYEYRAQQKVLAVHPLPPRQPGQKGQDSVMAFIFGMKAEEAKRRYEMTLQKPDDPNYYYIVIQPRMPEDKKEFTMARLVLLKKDFTPRQFWYVQPTKNEITYDIPAIEINGPNVKATDFAAPQVPTGWKMEMVPRPNPQGGNPPPRVVRPNG
jgi:TIGR03009 family protein